MGEFGANSTSEIDDRANFCDDNGALATFVGQAIHQSILGIKAYLPVAKALSLNALIITNLGSRVLFDPICGKEIMVSFEENFLHQSVDTNKVDPSASKTPNIINLNSINFEIRVPTDDVDERGVPAKLMGQKVGQNAISTEANLTGPKAPKVNDPNKFNLDSRVLDGNSMPILNLAKKKVDSAIGGHGGSLIMTNNNPSNGKNIGTLNSNGEVLKDQDSTLPKRVLSQSVNLGSKEAASLTGKVSNSTPMYNSLNTNVDNFKNSPKFGNNAPVLSGNAKAIGSVYVSTQEGTMGQSKVTAADNPQYGKEIVNSETGNKERDLNKSLKDADGSDKAKSKFQPLNPKT